MQPELFANMAEVESNHWWFRARWAIAEAVLRTLDLPGEARILDVGAGTGGTTEALKAFGRVSALEVDPEARRFLETHALEAVYADPLPDPAIADASFDLVTAFDVLEHLPDDLAVLTDIARLMKPGGHFFATVPAHPALWSAHDDHHHHVRRYRRKALIDTVSRAGLTVAFCGYWLSTLFPLFLAERLMSRLRPPESSEVALPPRLLNSALAGVVSTERAWLARRVSPPIGASLVVLAQR